MIDYSRNYVLKNLVNDDEMFNSINKLEEEIHVNMEEGLIEKDEHYFNKEEENKKFEEDKEEAKKILNRLEINNLNAYAYYYKTQAKKIRDEYIKRKNENVEFSPEEISNIEVKIKSNLVMAHSLNNLFNLTSFIEFCNTKAGKYKNEKYNKAKKRMIDKLENNKFTFHDPTYIEISLKKIFDNEKDIKLFAMRFYMYINTLPLSRNNMVNICIYFLILSLISVDNEEMKDRDKLIENIKKCV